jgi:RNA exonuclease 1
MSLHAGEARKSYLCCSAPEGSPGCQFGPVRTVHTIRIELTQTVGLQHVFLEKQIGDLHRRHPFSPTCSERRDTQLDIAAIDCEGMYTTQGLTVARVSIVDGNGTSVFDELVRPDTGVEVL